MNTRQLRHFLAVLDLGSLSAAAETVHLSLPALSRSLRALEDELRTPLFDRQDRRLRPTPYALAYAERARRIVFEEKEGARALALMRSGDLGSLHFGMGSSIALALMGPMLLQLLSEAPKLQLRTMVQSTDALLAALRREELDFFIGDVRAAALDAEMRTEPIHRCSFGWFARRGHPLQGRKKIAIETLKAYPLIGGGYAHEALFEQMAELYRLSLPMQDHFSIDTNDLSTLLTLLAASDAVAPATDVATVAALCAGSLVQLDVDPPLNLELTLGIIERIGRTRAPAVERAFEIVRAHFASVAGAVDRRAPRTKARRKAAGDDRSNTRTAR